MKNQIIKNFGIGVIFAVVLYTATFYFQELNRANEFNEFLEDASTISALHSTNAVNFTEILDFSEVDRESFESLLGQIQSNSQEAYQLLHNNNIDFTSKEKQLLEIATSSWLDGIELFQASITTLIDNPRTLKIEESIAQSIVSLSIGDRSYAEFLFLLKQNASIDGTFLPNFYQIEYIGLEDNSYQFADLLVDKAKSSSGGLFLQKNLAITGTEFTPMPITFTEDGAAVLLDEPTSLQVVISNEGNVEIYDAVVLILVTDEFEETVYEFQAKINSIGPKESKIFLSDTINIEKGVVHEWFVKIEEIVPVTTAIKLIPQNIMIIAKNLPRPVVGDISPYPTVVIVTIAHQSEFPKFENSPPSIIDIINPPTIQVDIMPKITLKRLFLFSCSNIYYCNLIKT